MQAPSLNEKMHEGIINNMIRLNKLPLKIKSKLINYFESLSVIDAKRCYYCGRLLGVLFSSKLTGDSKGDYTLDTYIYL